MQPRFEHDPRKNESNTERHGISLFEARALWKTPHVVVPARFVEGETRYVILGMLSERLFAAIFTVRLGSIRIISCHPVNGRWKKIYLRFLYEKDHSKQEMD